jgi:hypothetical protein
MNGAEYCIYAYWPIRCLIWAGCFLYPNTWLHTHCYYRGTTCVVHVCVCVRLRSCVIWVKPSLYSELAVMYSVTDKNGSHIGNWRVVHFIFIIGRRFPWIRIVQGCNNCTVSPCCCYDTLTERLFFCWSRIYMSISHILYFLYSQEIRGISRVRAGKVYHWVRIILVIIVCAEKLRDWRDQGIPGL